LKINPLPINHCGRLNHSKTESEVDKFFDGSMEGHTKAETISDNHEKKKESFSSYSPSSSSSSSILKAPKCI
jgi:hypothetical protein